MHALTGLLHKRNDKDFSMYTVQRHQEPTLPKSTCDSGHESRSGSF